jgi:hypothetical protein
MAQAATQSDIVDIAFVSEILAKTNMTRRYGRAKCGHRLVAAVPHGHWTTTTFVGALRCDGLPAPLAIDGAINGKLFLAYVEQVLVPTLKPGDVVIMENLRVHKMPGIREAIRYSGGNRDGRRKAVVYPALQPRLEPNRVGILQAQGTAASQGDPHCRGIMAGTRRLCDSFSPKKCTNYFRHDGYFQSH